MMNIEEACDRIVAWMRNAPPSYECNIGSPVSDEDLVRLAQFLPGGVSHPLEKLLKLHNGVSVYYTGLDHVYGFELQPVDWIIDSIGIFRQLSSELGDEPWEYAQVSGPVRPDNWNDGWIPFGGDGNVPVCLDMNPPARGVVGQIIEVDHEGGSIAVLANSLDEYLQGIVRSLPPVPAGV